MKSFLKPLGIVVAGFIAIPLVLTSLIMVWYISSILRGPGKPGHSRTDDYTIMHKQELDEILGNWEIVSTTEEITSVPKQSIKNATGYIVWTIEHTDYYGCVVQFEMNNLIPFDLERILKTTRRNVLKNQVKELYIKNGIELIDNNYLYIQDGETMVYNTGEIDFTSPAYYPKNITLEVFKNTNAYIRIDTDPKDYEKAHEIFNIALDNLVNLIINNRDAGSHYKRERADAYFRGRKVSLGDIRCGDFERLLQTEDFHNVDFFAAYPITLDTENNEIYCDEMRSVLSGKIGDKTADEIYDAVKDVKTREDTVEEQIFHIEETGQTIRLLASDEKNPAICVVAYFADRA